LKEGLRKEKKEAKMLPNVVLIFYSLKAIHPNYRIRGIIKKEEYTKIIKRRPIFRIIKVNGLKEIHAYKSSNG